MSDDIFSRAARAAASLDNASQPPTPARWRDGTLREGEPAKDSNGHPLDMERAQSGDFTYFKANHAALVAQRERNVTAANIAAEETAEREYSTRRFAEIKAGRERQAVEDAERTKREETARAAEIDRRWRIS
jgi:hypothetical protein